MSDPKSPVKLDIACGQNKQPGFTGIDISAVPGVDIVHNLMSFPWPIESDSVDEIFCSHYIEHIPHNCACHADQVDPFFKFFDEVWRILKVGAQGKFIAPYYTSMRCWQDPTHVRAISDATALYLNKGWRDANRINHYPISCDFDFVVAYDVPNDLVSRSEEYRQFAFRHYANSINDVHLILTKRAAASTELLPCPTSSPAPTG